jgi:hypothetical protein
VDIRYERKRLVVSAKMYFPYMDIEGVKNVPEELKDVAGNDVIRVLYGELIETRERVSPGDYIVKYDDHSIRAIGHKEFNENYTKLPYICPHCGKGEDDPLDVKVPDVIVDDILKESKTQTLEKAEFQQQQSLEKKPLYRRR